MKIRFIPAGVTLLAGAITCLICLMRNYEVTYSLEVLLIVLIVFTVIGIKAQTAILNVMREQKMQEEDQIREAEFREAERLRRIEQEQMNPDEDEEQQEEELEEGQMQ